MAQVCDIRKAPSSVSPERPVEWVAPLTREDYLAFKERMVDKLERMGLKDLRRHVVFEHCWTPLDIRQQSYSNKGSISTA